MKKYQKNMSLSKLRRTRQIQRRIIIMALALFIAVIVSISFFSIKAKASDKNTNNLYKYYKSVCVNSNDTLWDYAQKYSPDNDYTKYIEEVVRINNLKDDSIEFGMYVILPYYSNEFIG